MNVTAEAAQVAQMFLHALQNAVGMGPDEALQSAKLETGVTDDQIDQADMGEVFDYMCGQPGLDPHLQGFLTNQANNYNSYGNVNQGGSTYSGGGGGGYGGGGGGGAAGGASNAQIVQQVTQNYNYQEINDNHIDILGPVNGNIDIDQDNDDIDVEGDGAAVNSGDGTQNAATGDGSSAAQGSGAQSNSGDGAVQGGLIVGPTNTGEFTGNQVLGGDVENSPVGDGTIVVDNENGTIDDSALGFGSGDTGNASGNYLEEGSALSGTGDATGQSVDTNVQSDVNEEHGDGHQLDVDGLGGGGGIRTVDHQPELREVDNGHDDDGGMGGGGGDHQSDNFSPVVDVNVEGGAGDQHVADDDMADA
ncbi:hypothetical protein [Kineosporia sp. A_224]|uniref:hypothetical protein n=1 Tax=Kineosporia sp. A_224 TaxID=1962180 RepID=UPI000B4BD1DE|nr:hypothetical protein [Kineosporia sp. A_224]